MNVRWALVLCLLAQEVRLHPVTEGRLPEAETEEEKRHREMLEYIFRIWHSVEDEGAAQVAAQAQEAPAAATDPPPAEKAEAKDWPQPKALPTKGRLRFVELGAAVSVHRESILRIHADLSGVYHFIQEASHHYAMHMKHGDIQRVTKTSASIDECEQRNKEWSLLSPLSALAAGAGWTPGRINDTVVSHEEPFESPIDYAMDQCLYPDEALRPANITEGEAAPGNLTHPRNKDFKSTHRLGGLDHYSYDLASQITYSQLTRCARTLHQQLERFSYPTDGPRNVRQLMMLLGLGGMAFGIANSVQLWGVRSDLDALGAQVRGFADESRALGRTVAAFIDRQTELSQELGDSITQNKAHIIRTRSLLQLTVITTAACEITDHIVHSLDDLRSQRFPTNLFSEAQNQRFLNELTSSLDDTGLEPALGHALFLHFLPAGGVIIPRRANNSATPVAEGHLGADQGIITSHDKGSDTTTLKVKMTSRIGGSVAAAEAQHVDHPFGSGFSTGKNMGIELIVVLKVPLKRQNDPGFGLVRLDPTLIALSPGGWIEDKEHPGTDTLPEIVKAQLPGGLLRGHGALGADFLSEVPPQFLEACQRVGGNGPFLCSLPFEEPSVSCLLPLLNRLHFPAECLEHFQVLDSARSYVLGGQSDAVQVSLAAGHQIRTYCPGQEHAAVLAKTPGLYEIDLPPKCTVFAGRQTFTRLSKIDLNASVVSSEELQDLKRLELIRDSEEAHGWKKLKELKRDFKNKILTLRDLHHRLQESLLDRIQRVEPRARTYFWVGVALLLVFAITMGIIWINRRNRRGLARVVTVDDANRQIEKVYLHLNEHHARLGLGDLDSQGLGGDNRAVVRYRPVEGEATTAWRGLPVQEVLLPLRPNQR